MQTVLRGGGAIYFTKNATYSTVTNCNFINNNATYYGGAFFFQFEASYSTVTNCNFTANHARFGGAAAIYNGIVSYCNFIDNTATNNTATDNTATEDNGGALWVYRSFVQNCNFINNHATSFGGAVFFQIYGDAENCNFTANTATDGGAVYFFKPENNVVNCNFNANVANEDGGAIFGAHYWISTDTCIFKTASDTIYNTRNLAPILNVDNFTSVYGSGDKVTFDLKTNLGIPVTNGNISISVYFKDNDTWVGNYSCLSGEGWTVDLPVGSYYAIFDTKYAVFLSINRTITITVPSIKYYINVTSLTTNNKTVNITAKSNIPKNILWDDILVFILPNGTQINANYGANGTWWAVHTFDDYAIYQVNASYLGLDNVTVNNATINITKANSTITIDDVVLDYGKSINVTVATEKAKSITAKIDNVDVEVVNNFTIQISGLNAGNHTLTVTTITDDDHNPVTKTTRITVNKVNSTLAVDNIQFYYNSEGSAEVSFTGASKVIADVINQHQAVVNVNGKKITVSGLAAGTYVLNVTTVPDENHTAVSQNATITVNKINSTLSVDNVVLDYGEIKVVSVVAEGAAGISAMVDGSDVVVDAFNVRISDLKAGIHTLTVTSVPDENHTEVTKTVAITVNKINSTLSVDSVVLDYGEIKVVSVVAEGAAGISAMVDGSDVVVDAFNVRISDLKAGIHTLTVATVPDENHTEVTKTATVTVLKINVTAKISIPAITVGKNSTISVVLSNDATGSITVKVDGGVADTVSVKDGIADITIPSLILGNHTLEINYSGDDNYNPFNKTKEIISKEDTVPEITIPSGIKFGNDVTVDVKLPGDAGGNVTLKVDGVVVDNVPLTNGTASVKLPNLNVGNHVVEIEYSGDEKYNFASKNATVSVDKDSTKLSAANVTATYKIGKYIVITLTDSKGNPLVNAPVTVLLNGAKTLNADKNGQIKLSTKGLAPKVYTVKVTYNGDANYDKSTMDIKVTVNKAANPLKVKAKTVKVKFSKLKKKAQKLKVGKVVKFTKKGQGTLTYKKVKGNKKIAINKKTGKVTIKKRLKKRNL